jgi:hypothetical protein
MEERIRKKEKHEELSFIGIKMKKGKELGLS